MPSNSHRLRALIFVVLATIGLVVVALFSTPRRSTERVQVAVTSYPLLDIARSIAGPDLVTASVLPPGQSPHTFEPSPSTIAMLSETKVIYAIGHGFDDWVDVVVKETGVEKVVVDAGIALRGSAILPDGEEHQDEDGHSDEEEGLESEDDHGHGPIDPHYWLDGGNAVLIAQTIAKDLSARFPSQEERITVNLARTVERIKNADQKVRMLLRNVPNRSIVTLHDAWYYFAEAYRLEVIGSFEPTAAREPSPQYLVALEDAVRASGTTAFYVETGGTTPAIRSFAADNALTVAEIDPMEGASDLPYDVILVRNAQTIFDHQQ